MKLSSYTDIPASATLAMNALVQQKKAKGEKIFNLTVGEPMIETPKVIQEAAFRAITDGKTLYPPVLGIPELRSAALHWMKEQFQSSFQNEEIIVTAGGKHALLMTLQAILEKGDEVLIVSPYWVSYPSMIVLAGGMLKEINTDEKVSFKVTAENIASNATEKTRIFILNNGGNPTGVLYTKQEIEEILRVCFEKNIIVISDEVYSGLAYDDEFVSVSSFPEYKENTVVIQSVSKHFAMTGWRVGFALGPASLIKAVDTLQSQSTTSASSISQWAALAAFQNSADVFPKIKNEMQKRRDAFVNNFELFFKQKLRVPACGLYAFIPISSFSVEETDSVRFCMDVLEGSGVAFVPGAPFGKEGYIRASFGGSTEEVKEGLFAVSEYLKKRGS